MNETPEIVFTVFFSWQSDVEHNTQLIRECLRLASSMLEERHAETKVRVILDEATRGKAGSPNIPASIMEKIDSADAFVCDLSTINVTRGTDDRPVPNPNVGIELGYAIAQAGWSRIVMLFNLAHGNFPGDMPFDVDRQRASPFTHTVSGAETTTKSARAASKAKSVKELSGLLFDALDAIWVQKPKRPHEASTVSEEQRQRERDEAKLRAAMSSVHLPSWDYFRERIGYGQIPIHIFHFWESFHGIVTSSTFHLYDEAARELVGRFHDQWDSSLGFGKFFRPAGGTLLLFGGPGDEPLTEEEEHAMVSMNEHVVAANAALQELLTHIRRSYIDIDLDETSKAAWQEYVEFNRDFEHLVSGTRDEGGR